MILPNLILQKPSKSSKIRDHIQCMKERLHKWELGQFDSLFRETKFIQQKLKNSNRTDESIEKLFVRFMLLGKINSAIRLLENSGSKGVLPMTNNNLELLKSKHPPLLQVLLLLRVLY